jgi:hypothetical protein
MSSCCQERLEKIKHHKQTAYGRVYYSKNYHIYVINGHIFVADIRDILKRCITCDCILLANIYLDKDDYYVTHDGITRLSLKEVGKNRRSFYPVTQHYLPSFGTFLVKLVQSSSKKYIMMYNPLIQINKSYSSLTAFSLEYTHWIFEVNDEPVFCYETKQNDIILADINDNMLKMETIHSNIVDGVLTFKTPYGNLMGCVGIYEYPREWTFISNSSGAHTKPAIRPADD